MNFEPVWIHLGDLGRGLQATLVVTAISLAIGLTLGIVLAGMRLSGWRLLRLGAMGFIDFFRTTPPIVQLVWAYFVLPVLTGVDLGALAAACVALGLNTAAFTAEIYRAGIRGVDAGQWQAARVLSLNEYQSFRFVVLPQALRNVLPALAAQSISVFKATPIVGVLAFADLTYQANLIAIATARPTEVFLVTAAVYALIVYPASVAVATIEKRLRVAIT